MLENLARVRAGALRGYIDDLANFERGEVGPFAIRPEQINTRSLQLGIPAGTNAAQWAQIMPAIEYARSQGVELVVTVIRP